MGWGRQNLLRFFHYWFLYQLFPWLIIWFRMTENRTQLYKIFNFLQSNVYPPLLSSSRMTSHVTMTPATTLPTTPDSSTSPAARSALWWRPWPPWGPFQSPSMPVTSPSSFTNRVSSQFWETRLKLLISATCFFFVCNCIFFGWGLLKESTMRRSAAARNWTTVCWWWVMALREKMLTARNSGLWRTGWWKDVVILVEHWRPSVHTKLHQRDKLC